MKPMGWAHLYYKAERIVFRPTSLVLKENLEKTIIVLMKRLIALEKGRLKCKH